MSEVLQFVQETAFLQTVRHTYTLATDWRRKLIVIIIIRREAISESVSPLRSFARTVYPPPVSRNI